MIYAYMVDGLDFESREEFDRALHEPAKPSAQKVKSERQTVDALMNIPGVVRGR